MAITTAWVVVGTATLVALIIAAVLVHARIRRREQALEARAASLDERDSRLSLRESTLEAKAGTLELRESNLHDRERALASGQAEVEDGHVALRKRFEEIADYTADEARQELLEQVEQQVRSDFRALVREGEARAREEAARRARGIVATAIQRVAVDTAASIVTSTVQLPDDDLKGRIIGKEGRNVRAFEHVTGVDVVIDDTPGTVVLSSFDPVRRETARRALVALVESGRIHPASIEEAFAEAEREMDGAIDAAGEEAAAEAGVVGLPPDLLRLLGQLEYRSSYGQNVRLHSIEAALLAGGMAEELGTDAALARRCALLHDIGKALSHRVDGSHAAVGAEVARRLSEPEPVCHAIAAHHGEVAPQTVEAVLTQAADAVSASRPGARRDTLEQHCARMRRIEALCVDVEGVEQAYVMQAGREVRVMVSPDHVDDAAAYELSDALAARIRDEVTVPGTVTVTVIRELRARTRAS